VLASLIWKKFLFFKRMVWKLQNIDIPFCMDNYFLICFPQFWLVLCLIWIFIFLLISWHFFGFFIFIFVVSMVLVCVSITKLINIYDIELCEGLLMLNWNLVVCYVMSRHLVKKMLPTRRPR
jgi:succinate-acetate transporter protein